MTQRSTKKPHHVGYLVHHKRVKKVYKSKPRCAGKGCTKNHSHKARHWVVSKGKRKVLSAEHIKRITASKPLRAKKTLKACKSHLIRDTVSNRCRKSTKSRKTMVRELLQDPMAVKRARRERRKMMRNRRSVRLEAKKLA